MGKQTRIRIGTRQSSLALWQANRVKVLLENTTNQQCEIVPIATTGDINLTQSISEIGGKGIFLKEIEHALINDEIDIAVHSFKDITAMPNASLVYSGFILEESVTDCFILFDQSVDLNKDTLKIATGSLRRQALIQHLYPNIECVGIRGNVGSRIKKAKQSGYHGLMLSTAGLQRLNLDHLITHQCDPTKFIPAPGQGMIAIQNRQNDSVIESLISAISDPAINQLANIYYQLLRDINFNCGIPFGAYVFNDQLKVFVQKQNQPYFLDLDISKAATIAAEIKQL